MPNMSSQSKHVEFESNSALQIRNHKERRAEKAGKSRASQKGAKFSHSVKMPLHILVFFFASLTSRLTSFL